MRLAIVLIAIAACGDGNKKPDEIMPDSGTQIADAMADAPVQAMTFTSYVIDLVENQTSATTQSRPYVEFATLPDLDGANGSAYQSLF